MPALSLALNVLYTDIARGYSYNIKTLLLIKQRELVEDLFYFQ